MSNSTKVERRRRWACALTAAVALSGVASSPAGAAEPFTAAYSFTDSIGVNLRLSAPSTPYYNLTAADRGSIYGTPRNDNGTSAAPQVKALMADLGVKHARYDFCDEALAFNCVRGNATARTLATDLGVKFLDSYFGVSTKSLENLNGVNGGSIATEITSQLGTASAPANRAAIEAFEGPNEVDRGAVANWQSKVSEAQFQASTALAPGGAYASTIGGRTLLNAPMGSSAQNTTPTLVSSPASPGFHAFADSQASLNASNQHTYNYTSCPEAALNGAVIVPTAGQNCEDRTQTTTCTGGKPAWKNCSTMLVGTNKPIWVTEAGYTSSLDTYEGMSEKAASIYLPRMLLEGARLKLQTGRGWDRSYVFELLDGRDGIQCSNLICSTDREAGHGLVAANYAPKLQFRALKNLMSILSDTSGTVTGGSYNGTVVPSDATMRRVLFRKADGTYVLAMWRPVKVWNQTSTNWYGGLVRGSDIPEGTAPNTVANASVVLPTAKAVTVYRPSQSATAIETRAAATSHTVPVRGDVTLVTWR